MLLSPQNLSKLHVFKKGLKGLCGSLSSSCPLCCWGSCWPGPAGVGAWREGFFLSCKGGDNRKREDSTYTRCNEIICVHVYLLHWSVTSQEQWSCHPLLCVPKPRLGHVSKQALQFSECLLEWMDGYIVLFWFQRKLLYSFNLYLSILILISSIHSRMRWGWTHRKFIPWNLEEGQQSYVTCFGVPRAWKTTIKKLQLRGPGTSFCIQPSWASESPYIPRHSLSMTFHNISLQNKRRGLEEHRCVWSSLHPSTQHYLLLAHVSVLLTN